MSISLYLFLTQTPTFLQASLCNLSVGQVSDFREIFRQIDLDNNGSIDESELQQLLRSVHSDDEMCSENYIRELIKKVKNTQQAAASPSIDADDGESLLEFTVSNSVSIQYNV